MTKEDYTQAKYIQDKIDKVELRNATYDDHIAGYTEFRWHVETLADCYLPYSKPRRADVISDYEITKLMQYLDEIREQELKELYSKFEEI